MMVCLTLGRPAAKPLGFGPAVEDLAVEPVSVGGDQDHGIKLGEAVDR